MSRVKFFMDTEFIEDGETIKPVSFAIVCEDDCELYIEIADVDWTKAHRWVIENVKPHLTGKSWVAPHKGYPKFEWDYPLSRSEAAGVIKDFIYVHKGRPEIWAYCGSYDWVVFAQLFGTMEDLPKGYPYFAMDVKQLAIELGDPRIPSQSTTQHNALNDARWTRNAYTWLRSYALAQLGKEKTVED